MQMIFGQKQTPQSPTDGKTGPGTEPNGVVPPETPPEPKPPESPMVEFHSLFKNEPPDPNKPTKTSALDFEIDPQKMMEAAGKVDFKSAIPAELLAKIQAGGEDAVAANLMAMNIIAQKAYGQSAVAAAAITKETLKQARQEFVSEIPAMLKALNLDSGLRDKNPLFEDPAVVPILDGLKTKLLDKHPDATPQQLQSMAEKYVEKFASAFGKKPAAPSKGSKQAGGGDDDWEAFLNSP